MDIDLKATLADIKMDETLRSGLQRLAEKMETPEFQQKIADALKVENASELIDIDDLTLKKDQAMPMSKLPSSVLDLDLELDSEIPQALPRIPQASPFRAVFTGRYEQNCRR